MTNWNLTSINFDGCLNRLTDPMSRIINFSFILTVFVTFLQLSTSVVMSFLFKSNRNYSKIELEKLVCEETNKTKEQFNEMLNKCEYCQHHLEEMENHNN